MRSLADIGDNVSVTRYVNAVSIVKRQKRTLRPEEESTVVIDFLSGVISQSEVVPLLTERRMKTIR